MKGLLLFVYVGSIISTYVFAEVDKIDEDKKDETTEMCKLAATKKMLGSLGISDNSPCILRDKRDVANLVTSFIENAFEQPSKRDVINDFINLLSKRDVEKRGKYCCSPHCDKFMARMGGPHAKLISC